MRGAVLIAAVAVLLLAVAGCSGSSKPAQGPVSSVSSSAPAPTATTPTPTPTQSKPLSAYESDPAVKALRQWAVVAAQTVNSGHDDSAALNKLMTPTEPKYIHYVLNDVGMHYPGPLPFTPLRLASPTTAERDIYACFLATGFAVDPKTGKPEAYKPLPSKVVMQLSGGRWLFGGLFVDKSVSCSGVHVPEVKW